MKTQAELTAFAEGYLRCHLHDEHTGESIKGVDEWVSWDEYDFNFVGSDHAEDVPEYALMVLVYPEWKEVLPAPVDTFIVQQ